MHRFRLYVLLAAGRISQAVDLDCDSDDAAMAMARSTPLYTARAFASSCEV